MSAIIERAGSDSRGEQTLSPTIRVEQKKKQNSLPAQNDHGSKLVFKAEAYCWPQ